MLKGAVAMPTDTVVPTELKVGVNYIGAVLSFTYRPHERGRALLVEAESEFHIPPAERQNLRLYLPDDSTEVDLEQSLEQAGVKPDTTLTLRPPASGGGMA
jgi:hypothetical protein